MKPRHWAPCRAQQFIYVNSSPAHPSPRRQTPAPPSPFCGWENRPRDVKPLGQGHTARKGVAGIRTRAAGLCCLLPRAHEAPSVYEAEQPKCMLADTQARPRERLSCPQATRGARVENRWKRQDFKWGPQTGPRGSRPRRGGGALGN